MATPQPASMQEAAPSRALAMSTVAFTVCFAVWTIFSIIGVRLKEELGVVLAYPTVEAGIAAAIQQQRS